jgi:hypothetical protein
LQQDINLRERVKADLVNKLRKALAKHRPGTKWDETNLPPKNPKCVSTASGYRSPEFSKQSKYIQGLQNTFETWYSLVNLRDIDRTAFVG